MGEGWDEGGKERRVVCVCECVKRDGIGGVNMKKASGQHSHECLQWRHRQFIGSLYTYAHASLTCRKLVYTRHVFLAG